MVPGYMHGWRTVIVYIPAVGFGPVVNGSTWVSVSHISLISKVSPTAAQRRSRTPHVPDTGTAMTGRWCMVYLVVVVTGCIRWVVFRVHIAVFTGIWLFRPETAGIAIQRYH